MSLIVEREGALDRAHYISIHLDKYEAWLEAFSEMAVPLQKFRSIFR